MIQKQRLIERFLDYITIDSESGNERAFADRLLADVKALGWEMTEDGAGENTGNLYGFIPGESGAEPLLLTAHMDTVVPGTGICPVIREGVIYSKGNTILGGDDKSGIAAILEALEVMKENGRLHRPVELLFTVQEETGLTGSRNADTSRIKSRYSVAVDGCGKMDEIIVNGAGQGNITIDFRGVAAHAGNSPEQGVSAIMAAADAVSAMRLLKIDEETTANIGSFVAENPTNIVCSHTLLKGEVRSRKKEKLEQQIAHMRACVEQACKKYGAAASFDVTYPYESYEVRDEAFLGMVRAAYEKAGILCRDGATMVGSDSNILNQRGIASIVIPTGMTNPHALTEQIAVADMERTAEVILHMICL